MFGIRRDGQNKPAALCCNEPWRAVHEAMPQSQRWEKKRGIRFWLVGWKRATLPNKERENRAPRGQLGPVARKLEPEPPVVVRDGPAVPKLLKLLCKPRLTPNHPKCHSTKIQKRRKATKYHWIPLRNPHFSCLSLGATGPYSLPTMTQGALQHDPPARPQLDALCASRASGKPWDTRFGQRVKSKHTHTHTYQSGFNPRVQNVSSYMKPLTTAIGLASLLEAWLG